MIGDAVDAAVVVVAIRIARVVLHVADEGVVPVHDIERAIGGELEVHGPEVAIGGGNQVGDEFALVASAVLADLAHAGAEEADAVADHEGTLMRVGEMAGGDELRAGGGAGAFGHELADLGNLDAVGHLGGDGQRPPALAGGAVGDVALLPVIEAYAPGIRDIRLRVALQAE